MSVNSILKAIYTTDQKKAFYRQIIPESSCARIATVAIDILTKSRNGDRNIMQSIKTMSRPRLRKNEVEPVAQFKQTSPKVMPTEKLTFLS